MQAFGGITDDDAEDTAHYLLSLPPAENMIAVDCNVTVPPDEDAGLRCRLSAVSS
jgi:hypothetical protein